MAKIYISYSRNDNIFASKIATSLKAYGHEILIDIDQLVIGKDWRLSLTSALKQADGVIVIISKDSEKSQYVMSEIGATRAYIESNKSKFLIPVIFGDVQIPLVVQDIQCLFATEETIPEVAEKINQALSSFISKTIVEQEILEKNILRVERNASIYVAKAMEELEKRENGYKRIAYLCYVVGFISLVGGIGIAVWAMKSIAENGLAIEKEVFLSIKLLVIVGMIIGLSKYTFNLGKAFMNECLKNADRYHAISFGKFYLDAYGSNVNWAELKEAFQHWNIDKSSSFSSLDSNQYDPKFTESITEITKAFINKKDK